MTELQAFTYLILPLAIVAAAYVAVLRHERRTMTPAPAADSVQASRAHSIPFALKGIMVGAGTAVAVATAILLLLGAERPLERFLTSITTIVHAPAKGIRTPHDDRGDASN